MAIATWRDVVAAFIILAAVVTPAAARESAADRCFNLYQLSDNNQVVQPGVLHPASGGMPAFCQVDGVIDTTIRFRVSLPVHNWNGRFFFHALGGLAGSISDTTSLVDDGYAMATTDTGHEGEQPGFYLNANAKLNFGFRANHLTAVTSKAIIKTFYGRKPKYSYLWGCSNGGRAALQEAALYPDDFDGIIAGDPAIDYGTGMLAWTLEAVRHQAAGPLDKESVSLLDANSKRACDLLDGLDDGLIGDPRQCTVEQLQLEKLACPDGETRGCLTAAQIETATFVYEGVKDQAGNVVVPGVYPGAEAGGDFTMWVTGPVGFMDVTASELTTQVLVNVMTRAPGRISDNSKFDLENFDSVKGLAELERLMIGINPPAPDFSRYIRNGGKLIIYNGYHDHPCRAKVAENYFAEAKALNGEKAVDEFLRMFLVPGMVHCMGGPGAWVADYIDAIVDWVENDKAPDRLVAEYPGDIGFIDAYTALAESEGVVSWYEAMKTYGATARSEDVKFTRPLCPYPQWAKYRGSGDSNDAANFTCVDGDADKLSFASPEWLDMVESVIKTYAAENPDLKLSIAESFTDVPARLEPGADGSRAYVMVFNNGEAELHREASDSEEADIRVTAPWSVAVNTAVYVVDEDSDHSVAIYREMIERSRASGDLLVEVGDNIPALGGHELHNRIAVRTRP